MNSFQNPLLLQTILPARFASFTRQHPPQADASSQEPTNRTRQNYFRTQKAFEMSSIL